MAGITFAVRGTPEAIAALERLRLGAVRFGGAAYAVENPVVYAAGIETGRRRDGSLARRAGGAWMLKRGVEEVVAGGATVVADTLRRAIAAGVVYDGRQLLQVVAFRVQRAAMERTPVRTGTLRRGFHTRMVS